MTNVGTGYERHFEKRSGYQRRVIIIIIGGSTVFVTTLTSSHRRFHDLIKTLGRAPLDE
jgi:hypothetical protein